MTLTILVHWSTFGPFHLARLNAASNSLKASGVNVVGMEVASQYEMYPWNMDLSANSFERHTVAPGRAFEKVPVREMWQGVWAVLEEVNPDVVVINGYSMIDAWSALAWCKLHRRAAILMSDSKVDDAPRLSWREGVKSFLVSQYHAGLCAGQFSKEYLVRLGMKADRIALGWDAVDNDYFWRVADAAHHAPDAYRSMPGLESPEPFFLTTSRFVKLKNLDGLLHAYAEYRRRVAAQGRLPWRLVLVGDGEERAGLERQVAAEGIKGVSFPGFMQIEQLPIYYGLARAFVHPSFQDTWGLVVNEAMAAGLPAIVSKGAGCWVDLIEEGVNGYVFDPNDLETLANLMVKISSDEVDLARMSRAARERIQHWGLERFTQGLLEAAQLGMKYKPK